MPISNKAAAAPAFAAGMSALADKADNQAITSACAVLLLVRDSGGTNKKSASALWTLLPENILTTFQQVKRINGALNAPSDKASEGARQVRALWIAAKTQTAFVKGLLDIGLTSPRSLLDLVAPRKDKKETVKKGAVEVFLLAASEEGFAEDLTPILDWLAEGTSLPAMLAMAQRVTAEKEGKAKDAAEALAVATAKQAKAEKAKAAKAARDAERSRLHAEKIAQIEQAASAEKSAAARKAHEDKVKRERAVQKREIIEA